MPALTAPGSGGDMGATWCQRLNPTDATFLYLESPATPMHVGGVFARMRAGSGVEASGGPGHCPPTARFRTRKNG